MLNAGGTFFYAFHVDVVASVVLFLMFVQSYKIV
jgi:hypothetical protein